jgi:hypothetical protein
MGAHQPSGLGIPDQGAFVRVRPDSDPLGSGSAGDQTNIFSREQSMKL